MAAIAQVSWGHLGIVFNQRMNLRCSQVCMLQISRNYAARKGTRERAKKKKVKVEVKKIGFIPHNLRFKKTEIIAVKDLIYDDSWKSETKDDVWLGKYHKWRVYSFEEAVESHRETHHPTVYNLPNAYINAFIELDLKGERVTKNVEAFARTVDIPAPFDHGESRSVMAFAKTPELLELADKAGATITGGTELISRIQKGEVSMNDYTAAVAHPEIMAELSVVRGLMKRKFPNPRAGTLGLDLSVMIKKILHGIKYTATPHERQPLYGRITVPIGQLDMDVKDLENNFKAIIVDVNKVRPKRDGPFIIRSSLISPPSTEVLKVDFQPYLSENVEPDVDDESDDEEELVRSNVVV